MTLRSTLPVTLTKTGNLVHCFISVPNKLLILSLKFENLSRFVNSLEELSRQTDVGQSKMEDNISSP